MEVEGLGDDQFILDFVRRVHEREANALPHEKPTFQRPDSKTSVSNHNKNVYNNVNQIKNPSNKDQKEERHKRHLAEASCGNVANIEVISGQGEYTLYVDGERIGSRAGSMKANFETIIESHGPTVLAFEATRDNLMNFKENGGIAIQTSLCGKTYGTHSQNWVCTYEKPWTDAWKKWEYNTTTWFPARLVHNEGKYKVSENLSKEHNNYAIWSTDCSSGDIPEKAYCRTLIDHKCPNACFLANPTPQAVGRCWYNCDVNTLNYDTCTRFENRLNTMCSECDPEEIETARQNCVNYGCSAKQCNMEEDPELIPDLSCLNSCQKALGTTARSTCDTQKFYFTQGCDSCGPRALAYAKSLCLTEHKCSEEECAIGNENIDTNTNYAPSPVPTDTNDNNNNNNDSNDSSDPMANLPEDTPDVSCFFTCLRGTNQYEDDCDKTNYIFESGCGSRCPQSTLDWATDECLKYVSPTTGKTCSEAQCGL